MTNIGFLLEFFYMQYNIPYFFKVGNTVKVASNRKMDESSHNIWWRKKCQENGLLLTFYSYEMAS